MNNFYINKLKIKIKKETKYILKEITQNEDISLCKYFINLKDKKYTAAAILLGVSFSIKHIMVFFPLMLLFNQEILLDELNLPG